MGGYSRQMRKRRKRRREEEQALRKKRLRADWQMELDKEHLAALLDKIERMSDAERLQLCYQHGKELIDLTNAMLRLPADEKGRRYQGGFMVQGDRLYGRFYFGDDKIRERCARIGSDQPTKSIAVIIHPDCLYSAYPGDRPDDTETKVTRSPDMRTVQFALASWAGRVDPDFDEKLAREISAIKSELPVRNNTLWFKSP